jgi:hypothetical protein
MPSIPEQAPRARQVETLRRQLAKVLAYVEGASDMKAMMLASEDIIRRYVDLIEAEHWEPPWRSPPGGSDPTEAR